MRAAGFIGRGDFMTFGSHQIQLAVVMMSKELTQVSGQIREEIITAHNRYSKDFLNPFPATGHVHEVRRI